MTSDPSSTGFPNAAKDALSRRQFDVWQNKLAAIWGFDPSPDRRVLGQARRHLQAALFFYFNARYKEAADSYTQALALQPHGWELLYFRCMAYFFLGETARSLGDCDAAAAACGGKARFQVARAELRLRLGDLSNAAVDLRLAAKSFPETLGSFRGWTFVPAGVDEPTEDLSPSEKSAPHDPDELMRRRKAGAQALGPLDGLIRRHPSFAWIHAWRAGALRDLGRHEEALAGADRAVGLDPESGFFYALRARIRAEIHPEPRCLEDLEKAIRLESDTSWLYAWRGEISRKLGDLSGALTDLDAALARNPSYALAWAWRGRTREQMNDPKCISDFDEALRLDPFNAKAHAWRSAWHQKQERWETALEDLNAAIRLNPDCGWFFDWRRKCLLKLNRADEARRDKGGEPPGPGSDPLTTDNSREAIYLKPELAWTSSSERGRLLSHGRLDDALREVSRELGHRPNDSRLHAELGEIHRKAFRLNDALAAFNQAIAINPAFGWYFALRGRAQALRSPATALGDMDQAVALEPACGWIRCWRGEQLRQSGQLAAALSEMDLGLALLPDYWPGYAWRAAVRARLGKDQEALADLDSAILNDGLYAMPHVQRARIRLRLKDYGGAFADMERAISLDPKHSWLPPDSGQQPKISEKPHKLVLDQLRLAAETLPDSPWPQAWLGEIHLRFGDLPDAVQSLTAALTIDPRCALAYAWRGETFRRQSRAKEAARDLDRAVELSPDYFFALGWRALLKLDQDDDAGALRDLDAAISGNENLRFHSRAFSLASWLYGTRGELLLKLERPREAAEDLRRAVGLDSRYLQASLALAKAYRALNQPDKALEMLRQARGPH